MKKTLLISLIILLQVIKANAQEETYKLTVNVSGMETNEGKLFIALYTSEDNFLKNSDKTRGTRVIVKNKKAVAYFKDLKKGEYAISLFHDTNNNNKMDTKIFGIPKEPYGFSNNAKGFMGPPKFEDAKFSVNSNKTISIEIN